METKNRSAIKESTVGLFFFLLISISFLVGSTELQAHKSDADNPVHQWLAFQASLIWPNDPNHELAKYLFESDRPWNFNYDNIDPTSGKSIIKGAHDEDFYDPIAKKEFKLLGLSEGLSNFNSHFWDNGNNIDYESGLSLLNWKFWGAVKKAHFYFYGGHESYPYVLKTNLGYQFATIPSDFEGIISLYKSGNKENIEKAYYCLGRLCICSLI